MISVLPFFILLILPGLTFTGLSQGGLWLWAAPAFGFLVVPVFDSLFKPARERLIVSEAGHRLADLLLWSFVPLQFAILLYGANRASALVEVSGANSFVALLLPALATGTLTGGIGITIAHELVHRREAGSYWGGVLLLASVCYGHFAVEHVLGHHSHVATVGDPASARRGEGVWRFAIRSVVMGVVSAWGIEKKRLARLKTSPWSRSNRLFTMWLLSLLILICCFLIGREAGVLFFLMQSLVAVLLLEAVNYVEHYGLERKILAGGKPEPVQLWHSWDSHARFSGWFLIHLSRHADHHKYPARPFTRLEGSLQSPLLPAGYPACVLLATVPPLWYLVMHPRLDRFHSLRSGTEGI